MRAWSLILLPALGCSGFFEDNPEFLDTDAAEAESTADSAPDDTAGEPVCEPDEFEFNDAADDNAPLPSLMGSGMGEVSVMLEGPGAVDWYTYDGDENGMGPRSAKVFIEGAEGVRVCAYLKCDGGGSADVECSADEPETSPFGYPGCCGISETNPVHQCDGAPGGDVIVQLRVSDAMDRAECIPYTLDYRF